MLDCGKGSPTVSIYNIIDLDTSSRANHKTEGFTPVLISWAEYSICQQ